MKSIREKFEEIWPVPEGVYWLEEYGNYDGTPDLSAEWDYRLDTFTRCQEAMFSREDMNLFRQWFNSIQDTNPKYIEQKDSELYARVMERLK
jgi:hypothetical protein